jgi:hypothetical protein
MAAFTWRGVVRTYVFRVVMSQKGDGQMMIVTYGLDY